MGQGWKVSNFYGVSGVGSDDFSIPVRFSLPLLTATINMIMMLPLMSLGLELDGLCWLAG